jgi:histidyl-tRNA synthetase
MGSNKPEADAEIITLTNDLMKAVGLKNYVFRVGHVGVLRGILSEDKVDDKAQNSVLQLMDKKQYEEALKLAEDSGASQESMAVLRDLVDMKSLKVMETVENMRERIKGYETAVKAAENLDEILRLVLESGCKIDMNVDAGLARGLQYYTGMVFEVNVPELEVALGGGGRYDRLIELFGGEPTPAVGIAHGLDRIMLAMQKQKTGLKEDDEKKVMIIPITGEFVAKALEISRMLRDAGISVEVEVMRRKVGKALEDADRREMNYAIMVGEKELKEGSVVLRDLKKREQKILKIESLAKTLIT